MGKELPVIWDDSDVTWIIGAFFFPPGVLGGGGDDDTHDDTQCPEEHPEDCSWLGCQGKTAEQPRTVSRCCCSDPAVLSEGLPFVLWDGLLLGFLRETG